MISINILIMTDAEGLCGIYQNEQVKATHPLYGECRRYMTRQINELAAGFKGAGVERVYVRDCHGGACSAIWEDISADVDRIIQGDTGTNRMPYIESVDAVALLGYHAMAGTPTAVLEHTMMSTLWQKFMIHDTEAGEILLDASIAGDYGKPVILVAGVDALAIGGIRSPPQKSCRSRHRVSVHTTYCTAKTCGSLAGIDRTRPASPSRDKALYENYRPSLLSGGGQFGGGGVISAFLTRPCPDFFFNTLSVANRFIIRYNSKKTSRRINPCSKKNGKIVMYSAMISV